MTGVLTEGGKLNTETLVQRDVTVKRLKEGREKVMLLQAQISSEAPEDGRKFWNRVSLKPSDSTLPHLDLGLPAPGSVPQSVCRLHPQFAVFCNS